jgi:hypothetical protein
MDPESSQVGFSAAIDRMSFRTSELIFGRPGRWRERKHQYPPEPDAMPAHDGFRLNDNQRVRPS